MTHITDLYREDIERMVDRVIVGYPNCWRDRAVIKRRLLDGILLEPLAEEFDVSVRTAQNIVYKCMKKLQKHLDKVDYLR